MSDKEDNSWVKTDAGIATVGIKKESVSKVKEIIFIELPNGPAILRVRLMERL